MLSQVGMSRVTIREVARYAGVSHQTVSRVLNGSPDVAQETRAQVQDAIRTLDYHPNAQAVSLSRNRSGSIGMIVDRAGDTFFGPIVDGVCQALTEHDRFLLLAETDYMEQPSAIAALLRSRRIDGMILALPLAESLEQARQVAEGHIPLVLVDLQYPIDADHIAIDNLYGGYLATRHLLEQGHRRIGIICGPTILPVSQSRLNGYRRALEEYGVCYHPELVIPGAFTVESGVAGAEQLLALAEPPTAIFCSDDLMAIGALGTLWRKHIRVPDDISLIGFDDIVYAQHTYPPLTTVRQPLQHMGYLAGQHICKVVDGSSETLRLTLVPELVVRESTKALNL
jgi:LacI family transcriptional regulator